MADKKYLDEGGLTHLWEKIKSYLETWKTSNFGTGTYSNNGQLNIVNGTITAKGNVGLTSYAVNGSVSDFVIGSQQSNSTSVYLNLTGVPHGIKIVQAANMDATLKVHSDDSVTKFVHAVWIDTTEFKWHTNGWFLQKGDDSQLIGTDAPFFVCLLFW